MEYTQNGSQIQVLDHAQMKFFKSSAASYSMKYQSPNLRSRTMCEFRGLCELSNVCEMVHVSRRQYGDTEAAVPKLSLTEPVG